MNGLVPSAESSKYTKSMSTPKNQWVIRLDSEQVKGPYSTDAVNKMIIAGVFSGGEEISAYPDGEWGALTKQPEFYDALLESLENPVEVDIKKAQKMEAETVVRAPPKVKKNVNEETAVSYELPDAIKKIIEEEKEELRRQEENNKKQILSPIVPGTSLALTKANAAIIKNPKPNLAQISENNLTIHMSDLKRLKEKEKKKFLPFAGLLVVLAIGFYFLLMPSTPEIGRGWVLVSPPQKSQELMPVDEARMVKKRTARAFQMGQVDALLVAHKSLARVVADYPKDLEAMGMLCMAYHELWPYTRQTPQDLRSMLTVMQMARSTNPISRYSDSCQVVFLLAKGQSAEAKSLLINTIDSRMEDNFSLGPFLNLIKGQFFESEQNTLNALAYYEQSTKLWPQWITSMFGAARMQLKLGKYNEARASFLEIKKLDPESKIALYGLGLAEAIGFKNSEKAFQYFTSGYVSSQTIPKDFNIEALLNFAKILVERNENKKALEVAQKGYQINPSHRGLKELVLLLGGDDKVDNAQNEIILQGDQFARSGDHLAAQAQYKAAFEVDPKNAAAAFKAAKSLWIINQTKDAIIWLQKAIKADPKFISAYTLKADYEAQKYNFLDSAKTLLEASRRAPQNYEVLKGQALLEFRKNNMPSAIQYGERAIKVYDSDVELLSLLAEANINFYQNAPGTKTTDMDRKEQAKKDSQRYAGRAIDLEPSLPEAQITYAHLLAAVDGPLRGEKHLKDKIKEFPYTPEYRIALAEYYRTYEKFADAADVYMQVYTDNTKNKKAALGLAECYRIMSNPEMAQKFYNVASILDPSDVEPLFSNAKLLLELASGREAKAKLQQAIAKLNLVKTINPNYPRVSYFLAKSYMELGDFKLALDLIREEKMKNPNIADPYLLAAELYFRKEQFKECAGEYALAIKLRPSSAELYVKASTCYRLSNALEIAEDMLAMARQRESGFPEIYREEGFILEKKGQTQEVRQQFEKYLDLAPNAPDRLMIELKTK